MRFFLIIFFLMNLRAVAAWASDTDHDTHPVSKNEAKIFAALVCEKPVLKNDHYHCGQVIGYPRPLPTDADIDISFNAVAYGGFTRSGDDEAYVSYSSNMESHADNYGGGILFRRIAQEWKLVRWYPGVQMENCLAFSANDKQNMFCIGSPSVHNEALYYTAFAATVPESNDDDAIAKSMTVIATAEDMRMSSDQYSRNYQCRLAHAQDEGILLSLDAPHRSADLAFFAEAPVTYATPHDVVAACKARRFDKVKTSKGLMRFTIQNGIVAVTSPVKFAKTDFGP